MKTLTKAPEIKHNRSFSIRIKNIVNYVKANEQELRRKYANTYIAIYNIKRGILDTNSNEEILFKKYNEGKSLEDWTMIGTIDYILKFENSGGRKL